MKLTHKHRRVALVVAFVALGLSLDYALYPLGETSSPACDTRKNGAYLSFDFARGQASESPAHLAARMRQSGFTDLFFHVRYIGQSGRLRFDIDETARKFNAQFRQSDPTARRFAWVFVGNERAITGVDIGKPEIRERIAGECARLIGDGFDGIHLDYEISSDEDANFLLLLDAIRGRIKGHPLSVATPMWLPSPLGSYGWSENYFAQVAARTDQLVVMAYDSGLYFPRHYSWLVREQCVRVPRAVRGTHCRVLIGVPAYRDGGLSHHAHAENLRVALRAVREGLDANPNAARCDGVALFADYSMNRSDWATWKWLWQK